MIALDNSEASILGTLVLKNQTYRERANVHHLIFGKATTCSHLAATCSSSHLAATWQALAAAPRGKCLRVDASGCLGKWLQLAATDCSHLQRRGILKKNDVVDFTFCSRLSVVDC